MAFDTKVEIMKNGEAVELTGPGVNKLPGGPPTGVDGARLQEGKVDNLN